MKKSYPYNYYRDMIVKGRDLVDEFSQLSTNKLRLKALVEKYKAFNELKKQEYKPIFLLLRLGGIAELQDKSGHSLWVIAIMGWDKRYLYKGYHLTKYILGDLLRIDKHGNTSLMIALGFDDDLFIRTLLKKKCVRSKLKDFINFQNNLGNTALMIIAYSGLEWDEGTNELWYKGISFNDVKKNRVNYDELEIIQGKGLTFSDKQFTINKEVKKRRLMSELTKGYLADSQILSLKQWGGDVFIKNKAGLTALDIAILNKCMRMLQILNDKPSDEAEKSLEYFGSISNF